MIGVRVKFDLGFSTTRASVLRGKWFVPSAAFLDVVCVCVAMLLEVRSADLPLDIGLNRDDVEAARLARGSRNIENKQVTYT